MDKRSLQTIITAIENVVEAENITIENKQRLIEAKEILQCSTRYGEVKEVIKELLKLIAVFGDKIDFT